MSDAGTLLRSAREALSRGEHGRALPLLNEAVRLSPDRAECHMLLGVCLWMSGAQDAGVQALRHAIEIDPSSAEAHYNLGMMYRLSGQPDEATQRFEIALALRPDYQAARDAFEAVQSELGLTQPSESVEPESVGAIEETPEPPVPPSPPVAIVALQPEGSLAVPAIEAADTASDPDDGAADAPEEMPGLPAEPERSTSEWYDALAKALQEIGVPAESDEAADTDAQVDSEPRGRAEE